MWRVLGVVAALGALSLVAAACGGGDSGNGGEATKPPATTAPSATQPPSNGGEPSNANTIVGKNTLFDKTEITVSAGTVTFTFDNQDEGIVHNLAIYKGTDAKGENVGATDLEAGLIQQELTVELEPGTYYYQCDAHPATMYGTLTVE
jgi:plastocyanin